VLDNCGAIDFVFQKGKTGETYNIGSGNEKTNIVIVNMILRALNKPKSLIRFVKDRQGHDFRYSLDCKKIKELGWNPKYNFEEALKETIRWYVDNVWWWKD
jgi:dTDP-glucose 4,6-dehydratase